MLKVSSLVGVGVAALVVAALEGPTAHASLRSPFARAEVIAAAPASAKGVTKCPVAPSPVRDLVVPSKYGNDRREHDSTLIDDEAAAEYAERTRAVTDFSRRIASWADGFSDQPAAGGRDARCAMQWMSTWADQDALLGKVNSTGESVRKWELATIASAYLKIRNAPHDPEQSTRVRRWIERVANGVRDDYSSKRDLDSRSNNHINWAAWAVMAAAIATDNRELFDWSMDRFRFALRQIGDQGTLPLELKRRQLATSYHNYALAPLIMLREGASANQAHLSRDEEVRLQKLIDLVVTQLRNPSIIQVKSGYSQDLKSISRTHLAWLEPYYARSRDAKVVDLIEQNRPLSFSRLGGNLTVLFGVALPPAKRAVASQESRPAAGVGATRE